VAIDRGAGSNPDPQAHWAKLAFEKYYLWKMKNGYVSMP
jgi:hypothetical protein